MKLSAQLLDGPLADLLTNDGACLRRAEGDPPAALVKEGANRLGRFAARPRGRFLLLGLRLAGRDKGCDLLRAHDVSPTDAHIREVDERREPGTSRLGVGPHALKIGRGIAAEVLVRSHDRCIQPPARVGRFIGISSRSLGASGGDSAFIRLDAAPDGVVGEPRTAPPSRPVR